jgi:putative ABC transport system permease protein
VEAGVLRRWAETLVALYPAGFRERFGTDVQRLLVDRGEEVRLRGRGALTWFVVTNTAWCVRDAVAEWTTAAARIWAKEARGMKGTSAWYGLRLALKGLLRRPGYAVPVLVTLVLGIGASTATFTVLNAVVLRPLPYPDSDRIVKVAPLIEERGAVSAFSLPDTRDWEERARTVTALGAYGTLNSDLVYTGGAQAVDVETAFVTAGFFGAMGTDAELGRLPTVEEELGDNRVVAVSHAFWRQSLGADPAAVGHTIPLSGADYVVAGVMPESFAFPSDAIEVWAFLTTIPARGTPYHIRDVRLLDVVARMEEGVTVEQVSADLSSVARGLAMEYPDSNDGLTAASVVPLRDHVVGDADAALFVLMTAAGLILLITWANLANLALARETQRAPELAVRAALGASGLRRAGLVLTECVALSTVAGGLGLLVAAVATDALVASGGPLLPRAHEIGPDWRVAGFTLLVSLATGMGVALLASARAGRLDLIESMRGTGRGTVRTRARGFLVVTQVSLSVVLLVGAALLAKSLDALGRVDPGFEAEGLVVAYMTFASDRFPQPPEYLARFDETRQAIAAVPGVARITSVRRFPFRGVGEVTSWTLPEAPEEEEGTRAHLLQVGPDFAETMGIRVVDGLADFDAADLASGRAVMIIGESVARAAFPGERAVGRTLRVWGEELEIVGVLADIRQTDLRADPIGIVYVPNTLWPRRAGAFVVRGEPGGGELLSAVRASVRTLDARQPITELAYGEDILGEELGRDRLLTALLVLFAALALTLCSVGVYAVVAFGIARRRREVGIRLALGAEPARVRRLVVRQGMVPVMMGIAGGVALTLASSNALDGVLYSVEGFEPLAYGGAAALLTVVGLAACWLPARTSAATGAIDALAEE